MTLPFVRAVTLAASSLPFVKVTGTSVAVGAPVVPSIDMVRASIEVIV